MAIPLCITISLLEVRLLRYLGLILDEYILKSFLILAAVQYALTKIVAIFVWPFWLSPLRNLPGPKNNHFLLGQAYNLAKAFPSELEISWVMINPDAPFIRYLSLLNTEVLLVNNTQAQKEVLQNKCYSFKKPKYWERVVAEIAGYGILFTEGAEHKRQRKLLIAPFSYSNIKRLQPFFQRKASETTSIMRNMLEQGAKTIDMSALLSHTTLDVVGLAALGCELNSLSTSSPLAENYERIFEFASPLQITISVLNQYVPVRSFLPFEANRVYVNANAEVRRLLREHIRLRKAEFHDGNIKGEKASRDLLTLMIEESKDTWSEDEMLGYLLNSMSAGHESTAGSLTWALYALTVHRDMQRRLRAEVLRNITSSEPSQSEIEGLPYLNNVVREVLRFYAPAPNVPREATEDLVIENVMILKGTLMMIAPAAPQYNPRIWDEDADQFNPDRWDSLTEAAKDPYAWAPFLNGPRVCIGKQFALLEFKVILIELVRNFEFANTGPVVPQKSGPSLRPVGGLHLVVKEHSSD